MTIIERSAEEAFRNRSAAANRLHALPMESRDLSGAVARRAARLEASRSNR
jgi:hypothetical protein